MTTPEVIFYVGFVAVLAGIAAALTAHIVSKEKETEVSTVDDTDIDLDAIARLIEKLPTTIQLAIAEGTVSLSIKWVEVTRDEDDYPTIKPTLELKSTNMMQPSRVPGPL